MIWGRSCARAKAVLRALIPIVAGLGCFVAKETSAYWILFPIFLSVLTFVLAIILGIWLIRSTNFEYVNPAVVVKKNIGEKGNLSGSL